MFQYDRMPEEWDLKRIIVCGSQNSGKTVFIRSLVLYLEKLYNPNDINSFLTNDIRVLEVSRYRKLWEKPIQICIIDDAIGEGVDSRRSMSSANVNFTQRYFQIRHTLEKRGRKNGVIIVILATQDLMSVDKRIRENVQCTIYKTYYRKKWFQEEMNYDEDILKFIKEATHESLIKSNMTARSCGVGVTQLGDIFQFKNHKVGAKDIDLPLLLYESNKEELIRLLITKLMNRFTWIFEVPDKFVKGYLQYEVDNLKDSYPRVKITSADFGYIIRWGCYLQYEDIGKISNDKSKDNNKTEKYTNLKDMIFDYFEKEKNFGLTVLYEKFPEVNQSTLRNYKSEYLKYLESVLKMAKKKDKDKKTTYLQKNSTLKITY